MVGRAGRRPRSRRAGAGAHHAAPGPAACRRRRYQEGGLMTAGQPAPSPAGTMRERFVQVTTDLLDADPRLAVVLADITAEAFEPARRRHPGRVINLGIREQLLISVAGGLALAGLRHIAHYFASSLRERPFGQIKLVLGHQGAVALMAEVQLDLLERPL